MINLILASFISSIILCGIGIKTSKLIFDKNSNSFYENVLYGPLLLSFISIFINFLFPLNKLIGSIIAVYSIFLFTNFFLNEKKKLKVIKFLIITSTISILLVLLSNINRPDAGLYHLPYISLITENKIIIGSSNIHFRFGHISSLQYISALYNNYFLPVEFIIMPMATISSFFFYYLSRKFLRSLKSNDQTFLLFIFLTTIFSLYSFNRYSNYGNDAIVHMYFIIFIIVFLEINFNKITFDHFQKLFILSIFLFSLKPFMIVMILIPGILFLFCKKHLQLFVNKKTIFTSIFLMLWLTKNILVSGCLIYPLEITCFDRLIHFDSNNTSKIALESEAWAKDFPNIDYDSEENNFSSNEEFIENFNWLDTWSKNHLKIIIEKTLPFLFLLLIIFILLIFNKSKKNILNNNVKLKKNYIYSILISIILFFIWFIKFPIYRYGLSFIYSSTVFLFIYFLYKLGLIKITNLYKKILLSIFIVGVFGFLGKNLNRIYDQYGNFYSNYPWPRIYTLDNSKENKISKYSKIYNSENKFLYYYSGGEECMFSNSPCSNYKIDSLNKIKFFGYIVYYKENINQKNGT